jgi:hypothetical protein
MRIVLTVLLLMAAPAAAKPLMLHSFTVSAADPVIYVSINGQPLRLKVDLGTRAAVILNPDAARRAGLLHRSRINMRVGPVNLVGSQDNEARFEMAGQSWAGRVMWFDRNYLPGEFDGVISPYHLPYQQIKFEGPGEGSGKAFALPATYNSDWGLYTPHRVDGKRIRVRFSLVQEKSISTAAVGALIAKSQGGLLTGAPQRRLIGWDVQRPAQKLMLERRWPVGAFQIPELLVRLRDYRGKHVLPLTEAELEAGHIMVTGKGANQGAEMFMTLGTDVLGNCRSITYRRLEMSFAFDC